jgi:hypothetical protein
MNNTTKTLLAVALLSTVSACASSPFNGMSNPFKKNTVKVDGSQWDSEAAAQIDLQLAEAAEQSAMANETLAQIERTRTAPQEPALGGSDVADLPTELQRPTTVNWAGPAADLVRQLANNIGYTFSVTGPEPSVAIMASITATDEPAVKVLEDIGYQIAQFGEIFIDPDMKRMEFRYHTDMVAGNKSGMMSPSLYGAPNIRRANRTTTHRDSVGK